MVYCILHCKIHMKSYIQQLLYNNHAEPSDVGQGCQIAVKSKLLAFLMDKQSFHHIQRQNLGEKT